MADCLNHGSRRVLLGSIFASRAQPAAVANEDKIKNSDDGVNDGLAPAAGQVFLLSLILLAISSLLFFTRLSAPLLEPEEARYAEIPRQMLANGAFVIPELNGQPYYHKPPLLYWLVMTSYQIFGVHDWSARLVPGIAGVLIVLLMYWWGRGAVGDRAAFLSAFILCFSARFIYLGRMLTFDIVLCLFVVAGLLAGFRAIQGRRFGAWWWVVSALAVGFGIMTKGPVALVLVGAPLFAWQWFRPHSARPKLGAWLGFFALAIGAAAPWFLSMALVNWQAFVDFFWVHHVMRYVDPIDHVKPFWFYLPSLIAGMLPWSLLLIPLVRSVWRRDRGWSPALGFFLAAFLWIVFFYSCSGCKRAVYILPALPLLCLALGCHLSAVIDWKTVSWGKHVRVFVPAKHKLTAALTTIATLLAGIGMSVAAFKAGFWNSSDAGMAAAVFAGLLTVALVYVWRLKTPGRWLIGGAAMLLLFWITIHQLLPDYNRRFAMRGYVRPYRELCQKDNIPVACFPRGWESVGFYLQRQDVQVYSHRELAKLINDLHDEDQTLIFIKRDGSLRRFLAALPPDLEFVPFPRQRKKVTVGFVRSRWGAVDAVFVKR